MIQSTFTAHAQNANRPVRGEPGEPHPEGLHAAIIMDGNGRWAQRRGLPRREGHRAGAAAVRRTVRAAAAHGITTLTLYAFSSDNWRRPTAEVRHLMRLLRGHLLSECERCIQEGVRVCVIGRRDRLDGALVRRIESVESRTRAGKRLHLQLAIDYSARDGMLEAIRLHRDSCGVAPPGAPTVGEPAPSREEFSCFLARAVHAHEPIPAVDLLIRTGGEQRLSDFLLWECAYAELLFMPCLWPDFDEDALAYAVDDFRRRERRYGGLPAAGVRGGSHG